MMRIAFVVAFLGCRSGAPEVVAPPPEPVAPVAPDPQHLARGSYVVALAGCNVCHTPIKDGVPDGTRAFAGGLEVHMPDGGVWRSPNITPDRETGIGAWSDTQIITALRRGIRPDASRLLPIMPYPYFHRMSDSDAKAVVTYLRALRPIKQAVERSQVTSIPPVRLGEPENNVDPIDDPVGHGEYLANLMHCGGCHTPRTGPYANQTFAGGVVLPVTANQAITSANLTSEADTGLGQWSEGDILTAVRMGKKPDNTEIVGPMRAFMEGWARLDERDAHALAEYIKSVPPVRHEITEPRTH